MLEKLRMLTPYEAMTILILGGIGVGKSTFINVLVNYFAFEPLDALKTKPLSWFIPFSFSVQQPDPKNPNWKFIEFMITEKENEISGQGRPMSSLNDVSDPGQSSTQKTMVYSAQIGNTTLRLFDTPGISDIRGMARIRIALNSNTVYCFDSESFCYLAARHRGFDFGYHEEAASCWETSAKEAQRLIQYFRSRTPHLVKETINLNQTGKVLTSLTRSMAYITRTINDSIARNQDHIVALSNGKIKMADLASRLKVKTLQIKVVPLKHPRTLSHAMVEIDDEKIKFAIEEAKSDLDKREIMIKQIKDFIVELKNEYDMIREVAVKLCIFLKNNSITPYNDATLDYLKHLICEEQWKLEALKPGE
ncbi:hypothetical protein EX30DRAFT_378651 [Ascodesmis nigricans]|uniref:G domain-containing protein n=1 Tax=Ascodesmis nigricans TaxID=341454 RepID=A0A4S2MVT2_9PEZI|nr:hypothetical protein EX30DRAFT_378651 [Ascodesmis nigricans]